MIAILIGGQITTQPEFKKSAGGRAQVMTSVKARLGRDSTDGWQILAHDPAPRNALLGLKVGEHVAIQGVPTIRIAKVQGEAVAQKILHAQHVTPLRSAGGDDGSL
jgi:hypothetical protein